MRELEMYQVGAEIRYHIRRFSRVTEIASRQAGIEPQHYLTLLAIKGYPGGAQPTVGQLAERLQLEHNSTVEMIDRLVDKKLAKRVRKQSDKSHVYVGLTPQGESKLEGIAMSMNENSREIYSELVRNIVRFLDLQPEEVFPNRA